MNTETTQQTGMEEDAFLDQPIQIEGDIADDLIQYDADFLNGIGPQENDESLDDVNDEINFDEENPESGKNESDKNQENKKANPDDLNFDDDKTGTQEAEDVFKEEEAVERLKALGYNINKNGEAADPYEQKQDQINEIDSVILNIQNFIKQDDLTLCKQKITQDLAEEYKKQGREKDINSEEFNLAVSGQMDEYNYSPRMASLEANQIRSELKQYISEKEGEKKTIQSEIDNKKSEEIKSHRLSLQDSFKGYKDKSLFGQKLSNETIQNAYKKIVSGDFAKQVNSDKNIQAEFALFLEMRDSINHSGGATYGEGVAAAVNAINGKNQQASQSSLNRTVQRPSAGNSLRDRYESWGARTEVKQ